MSCSSTQPWMHNTLSLWINISKWWWPSKCNGSIRKKKWERDKCKWRLSSNSLSFKSRRKDGRTKWRWSKALSNLNWPMSNSRQIFSIVLHLCLRLWWVIPILASRIHNSFISSRESKKDSLLLRENKSDKLSLTLNQWIKHGMKQS